MALSPDRGLILDRIIHVERILDVCMATSLKAGGQGLRYTCRIANKQVFLFCDEGKWFIEKK